MFHLTPLVPILSGAGVWISDSPSKRSVRQPGTGGLLESYWNVDEEVSFFRYRVRLP